MCKGWQEGDHETREYPGMTRGPLYMDKCLVPILDALNAAGIQTKASCCGHGVRPGVIALADGRELIIAPDYDTARIAEGAFPSVSSSQESGAALVEQIETELAAPFEDGYGREFRYERLLRDALTELRRLRWQRDSEQAKLSATLTELALLRAPETQDGPSRDFLLAENARLKAALKAREAQERGWEDIATAPKDGTMVLIYPSSHWVEGTESDYEVTHWDVDSGCWACSAFPEDYDGPTHWMPLPSPPAQTEDSQ